MQEFFLQPDSHASIPSAPALLPKLIHLQNSCLQKKYKVIQTRHTNTPENGGSMGKWWRDLLSRENPLSQISSSLQHPEVVVFEKHQYDAFFQTELEKFLLEKNISQILITGVMSHLCCETTARSAFMRGFEVFFAVDGTATYNAAFHRAALLNLSHGFALPVLLKEIYEQLG